MINTYTDINFFKRLKKYSISHIFNYIPTKIYTQIIYTIKNKRFTNLTLHNKISNYIPINFLDKITSQEKITSIDISQCDNYLALGCSKGICNILDINKLLTEKDINNAIILNITGHTDIIMSINFSIKHNLLITGSDDKRTNIYELELTDKTSSYKLLTTFYNKDWVYKVCFSIIGNYFMRGSYDSTIILSTYRIDGDKFSFNELIKLDINNTCLCFSPCNLYIVTGNRGYLSLFKVDYNTGNSNNSNSNSNNSNGLNNNQIRLALGLDKKQVLNSIAFDNSGNYVSIGTQSSNIYIYAISISNKSILKIFSKVENKKQYIWDVRFTYNTNNLISIGEDRNIIIIKFNLSINKNNIKLNNNNIKNNKIK